MTTETLQKDPPQTGAEVTITIDNKSFTVHRGNKTVAELKQLAGISPSYELEEIIDGKLVPLRDDQHVVIKGSLRLAAQLDGTLMSQVSFPVESTLFLEVFQDSGFVWTPSALLPRIATVRVDKCFRNQGNCAHAALEY
jgi:hypothetical protein